MYTILKCRALGPDETITKTTSDEPSSARFSRGATIPCADAPAPPRTTRGASRPHSRRFLVGLLAHACHRPCQAFTQGGPYRPPPSSLSPPSQIQREDYHPLSLPPSQPEGLLGSVQMVYACANSLCMRELSVMVANKRLYVCIRGLMMKIYVHMYMRNVFIPLDNFACVSVCHVEYMNIHSSSTRLLISFKVIHPLTLKWPGTD